MQLEMDAFVSIPAMKQQWENNMRFMATIVAHTEKKHTHEQKNI